MTLVAFALTGLLAVGPRGPQLSGPQLDARTDEIGALLRCPVCQGLSVADSPAAMARNMKAEVREKLAAGYDQEQILEYFERSYGEFVRLEPPMRGVNWLVWFGPVAGLLAGGVVIAWALKRRPEKAGGENAAAPAASTASDLPTRDTTPGDARLAAAVRRVRMLAYGWPEGVFPKERS
jgi:cytochrome c-type biogenesis protein CcmH